MINKKKIFIITLVIIFITVVFGTYKLIIWHKLWTKEISMILPADVNKDGTDDLIVCYRMHEKAKKSLLKAIDLKNDTLLWTATVPPVWSGILEFQQNIITDNNIVFLITRYEDNFGITAISLQNGKILWKKEFGNFNHTWTFNSLITDNNSVYIFLEYHKNTELNLISLNQQTGKEQWKIEFGKYSSHSHFAQFPIIEKDTMLFCINGLFYFIDLVHGQYKKINLFHSYYTIWMWNNHYIMLNEKNGRIYTLLPDKKIINPYMVNNREFYMQSFYEICGIYKNYILYVQKNIDNSYKIIVQSLINGNIIHKVNLPQHFRIDVRGNKFFNSTFTPYHNIQSRFLPMILFEFIEKNDSYNIQHRWAVFDIEKGILLLKGNILSTEHMIHKNNFIFKNVHIFDLAIKTKDDKENFYSALFDEESGTFSAIFNIGDNRHITSLCLIPPHHYWQVSKGILYGYASNEAEYWAIDLKTNKTIYHSAGAAQLRDGLIDFKRLFGKEIFP